MGWTYSYRHHRAASGTARHSRVWSLAPGLVDASTSPLLMGYEAYVRSKFSGRQPVSTARY